MAGIDLKIVMLGAEKLSKALNSSDTIKKPLEAGLKRTALYYERLTKKLTPVDTDRLRSSITHRIGANKATIGTNVQYASFVEYGAPARNMEARHVVSGNRRILGKGPFTRALELLEVWLKRGSHDIHKDIDKEFK